MIKIALAGNPNCGKTTMFNALTGSNQSVGNWPGVTVEKKVGKLKKDKSIDIIDLPGIYSLSPYSLDEVVARNYLLNESPDVIINLVDATNLERNLYLTTQLIETGIPVVIALNMMDLVRNNKDEINVKKLAEAFACPVVEVCGLKNEGSDELIEACKKVANSNQEVKLPWYQKDLETAISEIKSLLDGSYSPKQMNWFAIKYFEQDEKTLENNSLDTTVLQKIQSVSKHMEEQEEDDAESIITNARYEFISEIMQQAYKKSFTGISMSDKIDKIVTNRWLALPIFVVIMTFVYYVSVSTVGKFATDWVNEGVFGEGWHLFGIEQIFIPSIPDMISSFLESIQVAPWLSGLIIEGIVAGVGAVLGFVPQMLILFFFLAILEDVGYMARIAFILDRVFRKFGLSGKSFIPMLIGTGCGVPGVMASRTIENENDRRMTILTTTFIPCSAKLPVIALITNVFFEGAWWVSPMAYFIGIAAIVVSGIILKKTKLFRGDPSPFILELPSYHMPKMINVGRSMWERGWSFICKASTVILLAAIVIWFLSYFGFVDGSFQYLEQEQLDQSILAMLGNIIAPLFAPLGWGGWRDSVAAIAGLVAKENVIATYGILYGFAELSEEATEIWVNLGNAFTPAAAFSFLVFNLLCAPCFAAIGAIKREMNNKKWTIFAIAYQCVFAYVIAFIIYQISTSITTGVVGIGTILAIICIVGLLYLLCRKEKTTR